MFENINKLLETHDWYLTFIDTSDEECDYQGNALLLLKQWEVIQAEHGDVNYSADFIRAKMKDCISPLLSMSLGKLIEKYPDFPFIVEDRDNIIDAMQEMERRIKIWIERGRFKEIEESFKNTLNKMYYI